MLWILQRRTKFAGWIPLFPQMNRISLCREAAALPNLCLASTWKISVRNLLTKQSLSSYHKAYKHKGGLWSINLTNMPNKCGYLTTAFLARQLFSKHGKSSTPLTSSPRKVQWQIPCSVQRDGRWMNFTHTHDRSSQYLLVWDPAQEQRHVQAELSPNLSVTNTKTQIAGISECRQDPPVTKGWQCCHGISSGSFHGITAEPDPCSSRCSSKVKYFLTWGWKHPHCLGFE